MKAKKEIFKKYFILQFTIVSVFIMVVFPEFKAGEEFQVNTYITSYQKNPAVAMDWKGNFIITWAGSKQDGDGSGIFAQRFDKEGLPIGPGFQVNTYTENHQSRPEIAMDKKGNFVITWDSCGQDGDREGIFAKMYKKQKEESTNSNVFQNNH